MVIPPIFAREADDALTFERVLILGFPPSVPLHPGLHFSRQHHGSLDQNTARR